MKRRRATQLSMLTLMGVKTVRQRVGRHHGFLMTESNGKPQLSLTTLGPNCPEGPTVLDLDDEAFEALVAEEISRGKL